jgi:hypothetical protein
VSDLNPYDLNNLAGGAIRALFAPITEPVPTRPEDIFLPVAPYTPQGGWVDFGATTGPFTYTRGITKAGASIQQETSAVLEDVTETIRTVAAPFAEMRPEVIKMIEEGGAQAAVASTGVGESDWTGQPVGSISELTRYRMAFVARRKKAQGQVREGVAGPYRGRFLVYVAYQVELNAESVSIGFERGALASATVTFKLYPEPTITDEGEEFAQWFDEDANTIALV